jgi:hypothetical protein
MQTFLELQAIEPMLEVQMRLDLLGDPRGQVCIAHQWFPLQTQYQVMVSAAQAFDLVVLHHDKTYQEPYERAIVIIELTIGIWRMTDAHNHLVTYQNDRGPNLHTRYLGFNGEWRLNIDRAFWLWHHHHTGQGMLICPVKQ